MKRIILLFTLIIVAMVSVNAQNPAKQDNRFTDEFTEADSVFNEILIEALSNYVVLQEALTVYQGTKADSILQAIYVAQVDSFVYVEKTISKETFNRRKILDGKERLWVEVMIDEKPPSLKPFPISQQTYNTWLEQKKKELIE